MHFKARVENSSISLAACKFSLLSPPPPKFSHAAGTKWDGRWNESTRQFGVFAPGKVKGILLSEIFESVRFGEYLAANKPFSHTHSGTAILTHGAVCPRCKSPFWAHPQWKMTLCMGLGLPASQVNYWGVLVVSENLLVATVWVWWGFLFYFLILLFVCFFTCKLLICNVKCVLFFSHNTGLCFDALYYAEEEGLQPKKWAAEFNVNWVNEEKRFMGEKKGSNTLCLHLGSKPDP